MPAKRCAWPMAMPPETPMPCIVKQTVGAAAVRSVERALAVPETVIAPSLAFAELVGEELLDRVDGLGLVRALGLQFDRAPDARGEHHHAHDALRVHAPAVARDPYPALVARGRLRELGRRTRVQAELVGDRDGALEHGL